MKIEFYIPDFLVMIFENSFNIIGFILLFSIVSLFISCIISSIFHRKKIKSWILNKLNKKRNLPDNVLVFEKPDKNYKKAS